MKMNTGEQLREISQSLKQDQRNYLHEVMQGQARIAELEAELAALKSAPVVMPDRATDTDWLCSNDEYNEGWNDCLDEFERLNRSKT